MLSKLIAALQDAALEMTAEEIADMLWLALQMDFVARPPSIESDVDISDDTRPDDTQGSEGQFPQKTPPPSSTDIHMNPRYSDNGSLSHLTGLPFRSPAASALPDTLSLARALRPFMRRFSSKTTFVFNENATVQTIAEAPNTVWLPILDPAPVRWFDIALVIDEGASMALWKDTVAELRTLLEHLGAFRDVRIWRLATDDRKSVQLYAETGITKEQSFARNPKELIDPSGRRLILVVTDCVSLAWHSGEVQQVLDIWGKKNLVTLIQMLPRRLWHQTALDLANTVQIGASLQEIANASLKTLQPFQWFDEDTSFAATFPVPVVTLEPRSLLSWSHIVTGSGGTWITGKVFEKNFDESSDNRPPIQEEPILSASKRVQLFHANASQIARRLAGLLAAAPVPVSFQVIRLIRQTMLPQAGQVHIAEVLLSGLLEEIYRDGMATDPDHVEYDFIGGIRDELLNAVPIPDGQRVLREISTFIGQHYGQTRDFLALVTMQEKTGQTIAVTSESRPFAQITATVLRRFGGDFASLAENLEMQVKLLEEQSSYNQISTRETKTTLEPSPNYSYTTTQEPITPDQAFLSKTWCDLNWTEWIAFDSAEIKTLPTGSGVYRIRAIRGNELFFIGHTGRNLRERIGDLIRNTMRDLSQMPFNDPHTAAPSLWAWRDATGISFECSVFPLTDTFSEEEREALVHYLLWQYRLEQGKSTLCNYGRIHPHYVKSGNRSTGRRGYQLPEGQLNNDESPSFPPLRLAAMSHEKTWMGLEWSGFYQLDRTTGKQDIIVASGVYKILDTDTKQLLFIGYSANLRTIFQTQARKNWLCPHPSFAFSVFPKGLHSQQAAEIESDLIGGYYTQTKTSPKFQFKNHRVVSEEISEVSRPVDVVSPPNSLRTKVFISYSHKDREYLQALLSWLKGVLYAEDPDNRSMLEDNIWHDQKKAPSVLWKDEIMQNMKHTKLAVTLISQDYLASSFIQEVELPTLYEAADSGDVSILPVLLKPSTFFYHSKLSKHQAIDNRILSELEEHEQEVILMKLAGQIYKFLKSGASSVSTPGTIYIIYRGHSTYLVDVAWSPDGKFIASGGGDGIVRVWDANTGNTLYTTRGQKGTALSDVVLPSTIWSIVWSPDSTTLAFAGTKAPVVWRLSNTSYTTLKSEETISSFENKPINIESENAFLTETDNEQDSANLRKNPRNGLQIATYQGHSSLLRTISSMAWSPDGQFIASTNLGGLSDQSIHVWQPEDGMQIAKFDVRSGFFNTSSIGGVAWSPDNTRLACGFHGEIRIYDIRTWRHLQTYKHKSAWAYYSVCWTPDEKMLISSNPREAVAWDTATGKTLYIYSDHSADIRDIAVSPDCKYVASASNDTTVHIWEAKTGKRLFQYEGHKDEVAAVSWSPDGTRIASACKDGTIHVWQAI